MAVRPQIIRLHYEARNIARGGSNRLQMTINLHPLEIV